MVLGFYISFDPPGALGVGMCLAHAVLSKEMWLAKVDVNGEWNCWGKINTIHADNAKEFRGNSLARICEEYGMKLEWRRPKTPHWGGHIERYLGTLMKDIHTLPGSKSSNPKEKGDYDPQKEAVFTLPELEQWITTNIVNIYHKRIHTSLGKSPEQQYKEGVFGTGGAAGTGIPRRILDERKVRLDFLPYEERTVQEYGVVINHIYYYHDVLRKWIHARNNPAGKNQTKRKFIFKTDPRNLSVIYFLDPELKQYFEIPYRNNSRPPITVWELREAIRRRQEQGYKDLDEEGIFAAHAELKRIAQEATTKTQQARRIRQEAKKKLSLKKSQETIPAEQTVGGVPESLSTTPSESLSTGQDTGGQANVKRAYVRTIKPFEELEDGTSA
jgi:putative transposase